MKINEIIRERRIAKNMTQEQMAGYLGVTAPAINKWEKGTSYPDITLLPVLARLLGTDLNTLLSFKDDLTENEIGMFLNELSDIADKDGVEKAFDTAMNKIKEFPTCYPLILNTALLLEGLLIMNVKISNREQLSEDVEALYTRVLESNDSSVKNQAKAMLVSKYMKRKDYEQAQELIDSLPDQDLFDKKQMYINLQIELGNMDEAAKIAEEKLLSATNEIHGTLMSLMEIAIKQNRIDDAEYIADVDKKAAQNFDLWEYNSYVAHSQLYDATKQRAKSIKILIPMLKSLTRKWEINKSPLYRHIKTKDDNEFGIKMQKTLVEILKNDEEYDYLHGDKEMEKLFNQRDLREP